MAVAVERSAMKEGAPGVSRLRTLAIAAALSHPACKKLESTGIPPLVDAEPVDGPVDAKTDGGIDGGPTACLEAMPAAPWTGLISNGAGQNTGGYVFTYRGPDAGNNTLLDIECGGMLRYGNQAFPEDVVTTLDVAIDGRVIKVTPHSLNASQVNITLEVQ